MSAGLHSAETSSPEAVVELVYRLAVSEEPFIKKIRDNVIVSVAPTVDLDGRDRAVDWYNAYKIDEAYDGGENYGGPPYWGKYVFHDNNRDINYGVDSLRAHLEWYLHWLPPVWHDLHEAQVLMYTFSGQPPQNANLDPILYSELPFFATYEVNKLTGYGMPGVWHFGFVDMWSPGYLGYAAANHNGMLRMYEIFNQGGASTKKARLSGSQLTREWYRPKPAPAGEVDWSIRNAINYAETGVLTALELTSTIPGTVVENFYKKSVNGVAAGAAKAPYAFVLPAGQPDQTRVDRVVNLLRRQAIEVHRATADVGTGDARVTAGSYLVRLNQPYGRLAKTLLEKQNYPDASLRTYDDSAWTMGLASDVDVRAVDDVAVLTSPAELLKADAATRATLAGALGTIVAVKHTGALNLITLRFRLAATCRCGPSTRAVRHAGWRVPGRLVPDRRRRPCRAHRHRSDRARAGGRGDAGDARRRAHRERRPAAHRRLHHLGQHREGRLGAPRLRPLRDPVRPHPQGPCAAGRASARQVRRDRRAASDAGRKGAGLRAAQAVEAAALQEERPVQDLRHVCRDRRRARRHGHQGRGRVQRVRRGRRRAHDLRRVELLPRRVRTHAHGRCATPAGHLVRARARTCRPRWSTPRIRCSTACAARRCRCAGPKGRCYRWPGSNPELVAFTGTTPNTAKIVLRFPGGDAGVLSGLMRGADQLRNRPALVDAPVGQGRVLLYVMNPIYRWQTFGEHSLVFNGLLFWNDLDRPRPPRTRRRTVEERPLALYARVAVSTTCGSAIVKRVTLPPSRAKAIFTDGTPEREEHQVAGVHQEAAVGAGPLDAELVVPHVDHEMVARAGAELVACPPRRRGRPAASGWVGGRVSAPPTRFEIRQHRGRAGSPGSGVRQQGDAVRPQGALDAGTGRDERLHHVELTEHGRREHGGLRAVGQEQLGNLAAAGVRRGAERRFPVAEPPVDRGAGQRRLAFHQLAHPHEVAVRHADDFLGQRGILARQPVGGARRRGACAAERLHADGRQGGAGQAGQGEWRERTATAGQRHEAPRARWTTCGMVRRAPAPGKHGTRQEDVRRATVTGSNDLRVDIRTPARSMTKARTARSASATTSPSKRATSPGGRTNRCADRCTSSREPDEVDDEAQAVVLPLQLAEHEVVGVERRRQRLQIADVARLAQRRGVADDADADRAPAP